MPTLIFPNLDSWEIWVDNNIVTNGMELITGNFGNITENAAIQFIRQSPLNWQTANVISSGGIVNVTRPVNVIISSVPASLSWGDNIYNQYIFINTVAADIPLATGSSYYDINLQPVDIIPAKSIVNICKASNSLWVVSSVPYSGSNASVPPLIGVVGNGGANDPVANQSIFQSNKLIGLGATNDGNIEIKIANVPYWNFGDNASFVFNNVTGQINLSPNTFITGNGLYINLNQ